MSIKSIALIPARSGSKRVPHKNIKVLGEHPLVAYSIRAAIDSGVFDSVVCATDSERYAEIASHYGADVPVLRPKKISSDKSPDIEWVTWMLDALGKAGYSYDIFSILRPTSPFRHPSTIQRAWELFLGDTSADSLRAVERCSQHPGKMWTIRGDRMLPLMPLTIDSTPWHSSQYSALPEIYVQNASLEIAWSRVVRDSDSISGESVRPFITEGYEGFDINEEHDLWQARRLLKSNEAALPKINCTPFSIKQKVGEASG